MSDWFFRQGGRDKLINWLGLDAWIDSSLSQALHWIKSSYMAASSFFARFKLQGWSRVANELASESLTLGAGGLLVIYVVALPAFQEIDRKNWLALDDFSVTFQDRNGNVIGKRGINLNNAVPIEEIPDYMVKAALATEDRRFFEHFGVDFIGTFRALVENVRANSVVQGGSTLTQQLAKNLFLSPERSITRKLKELFLSFWLESRLTKQQILKLYLDRAYMGGGAFGVEAASQFYFGKSIRDISMAEGAMLAGLFKAPSKFAPHINLAAARARANEVLSNLVEAGYYTSGQVYNARLNPATPIETQATESPDWFLDYAYEEIRRRITDRSNSVLTARTTIDLDLQKAAEEAVLANIPKNDARRSSAQQVARQLTTALVSLEKDGAVRAMVGGTDYGESQFNRATSARRQPGSSFKVYVYAAALENGYTSQSILRDQGVRCGNWSPKNYSGGFGSGRRVNMADALRVSLNTTAVAVSLNIGRETIVDLVNRLGIEGPRASCSMALGDVGITPISHVGGFAPFANDGKKTHPYALIEVFNTRGELVYSHKRDEPPAEQIFSPSTVEQMNQMLVGVVENGTGKAAQLDFTHAAGKTGTSSSYRDAWFVGYTGQFITGVWVGRDDFRPVYRSGGRGITGGSVPAAIWQGYMASAHKSHDIPTLAGLPDHPAFIQEQQRLAALRRQNPLLSEEASSDSGSAQLLPPATIRVLENLASTLRSSPEIAQETTSSLPFEQVGRR